MAKILDAQKYGKDALPILNDCENYVMVENVNSVIPCNSNLVFDDNCMLNNTSCNNLDFKTSFDIDVSCYSNSDFDNNCTLNSTKSYTSDNTSCNNLDFKTSFDIDVSCNSNLVFDDNCMLNNTSCNNLDFKTSFDIDVSCYSNSDFDNDCTLNSTKSYTSDNTSCNNLDFKTSFDIDVSCNINSDFDNNCTLNSTKSYTSDNTSCSLDSTVSDLHDTIANPGLSDISFCSSVNKEHLVLNEVLSHKNCISFNECISNDDHIDQSSLHEYVVAPSVDKCDIDIDIERPVIVSDNVSHVNDNHDIGSCIPSIPIIDCDDSVAYSLLSEHDKDNNGISFNKDDTNFIDVNHSFQCSLKPINNEDHGQSDTKSSHGNNEAKMSHGSNLSVLYFNARSIKNKLRVSCSRVLRKSRYNCHY